MMYSNSFQLLNRLNNESETFSCYNKKEITEVVNYFFGQENKSLIGVGSWKMFRNLFRKI